MFHKRKPITSIAHLPNVLLQTGAINHQNFEAGNNDGEGHSLLSRERHVFLSQGIPLRLAAVVHDDWTAREPFLELIDPIGDSGEGTSDQVWPRGVAVTEMCN